MLPDPLEKPTKKPNVKRKNNLLLHSPIPNSSNATTCESATQTDLMDDKKQNAKVTTADEKNYRKIKKLYPWIEFL